MRLLLVSLLALILSACSSSNTIPEVPAPVAKQFTLEVAQQVNPYGGDNAHPVVVRVYQLTETGAFNNAAFLDLYQNDQQILASSLVDTLYLDPLLPGSQQDINIDIHFRTKYLAVFAEFSEYENAVNRAVLKLGDIADQDFKISLNGLRVEIIAQPKPSSWWQIF